MGHYAVQIEQMNRLMNVFMDMTTVNLVHYVVGII